MTPDLLRLRDSLPALGSIVERLELELVDDPRWAEPSDASYLSEADLQNPDIAANVDAMTETNKLISWFGRDAEGFLGLWHGPTNRAPGAAPVVRLDTEGQYSIVAATLPEYLAIAMPEDEFATTRQTLTSAGFKVGFNPDAIWAALDAFDEDPNAYRNELYEQNRVARGLPRSDAADEPESEAPPVSADAAKPIAIDEAWGAEPSAVPTPITTESAATKPYYGVKASAAASKAAPASKPAANQPAAKQPAKAAAKKPAAKPPAKKAAAKPAAKAAAKPAKKAAAKPAKKRAAKPTKSAAKKSAPAKKPAKAKAKAKKR